MGYATSHGNTPLPLASCEAVPCCFFGAPSVGAVTCFLSRQSQSGLQKTQGLVNCTFCVWHGAHFLFSNKSSLRCVEFEQQKNIYRVPLVYACGQTEKWTNCRVKSHQTCKPPGCDAAASRVFGDGQAFFLSPNLCVCDENGDRLFIYVYIYIFKQKKSKSMSIWSIG